MSADLAPYDAVLVVAYGGPEGPDDVVPFLRNATAGRDIPDERLARVGAHYFDRGGVSPINARTGELRDALADALALDGVELPVVVGNRNWHPFIVDSLRGLADSHARRVLAVFTSAYRCYSSCRQYRENLSDAVTELAAESVEITVERARPVHTEPGFIEANADALVAAFGGPHDADHWPDAHVVFVTHSIPVPMNEAAGPPGGRDYADQTADAATAIATAAGRVLGRTPSFDVAYCSRSGPPQMPWLAPDVNDRLRDLAGTGVRRVVVAPIGFTSDHMEVVQDLDTEAAATAAAAGLQFRRAATVGASAAFVAALLETMYDRAAAARDGIPIAPEPGSPCSPECCLPRPKETP